MKQLSKGIIITFVAIGLTACGGGSSESTAVAESTIPDNSTAPDTITDVNTESPQDPTEMVLISEQWQLIWQDEFDNETIDLTKWTFEVNCFGGGNDEQQCYTDRAENAFIEQGVLKIVALKENFTGPAAQDDDANYNPNNTRTLPYTSARLRSKNKGDWTYGRFEIRARLPQGQGTWPAIWMLPTEWAYGGWAGSGEIDIMEAVNLKAKSDEKGAWEEQEESRVHLSLIHI